MAPTSLTKLQRQQLLELAKNSIRHGLRTGRPPAVDPTDFSSELAELRATFVTLHKNRQLRGCIGLLKAARPLAVDVSENAFAAAFKDPRFPPVETSEFNELDIHISILTPAEPLPFASEQDLIEHLQPGVDGLILEEGNRRGTFLPSVWQSLPKPRDFLRQLKQKAGLPEDYWSDRIRVFRYRTEEFGET
ncbi:AmmeMemoRadiSam system protein A [Methylosarcina fibrata]|uniref:AmmeMemoRadiSam system protein A n=1 Tax=Methylosarcina fibrata TaxID=105972 RepID=UPI00036F6C1C|nr:AmmeMemoRadiSam system protein A [Methylosarcina fibrata]